MRKNLVRLSANNKNKYNPQELHLEPFVLSFGANNKNKYNPQELYS